MNEIYDLIIIGAGPAGLSCAIEAKRAGLSYLVVDKGGIADAIQHFQRDMFFFSTPELLEIGDVPFVIPTIRPTSLDCVNYYRAVSEHYALQCCFHERILSCHNTEEIFVLKSDREREIRSRAVVVATGYYDSPTPLGVPGEQLSHVSHYYRDPLPYYQQDILIVGGKNSAVEAALDLWRHGVRVTVVHRAQTINPSVKYWIMPDFQNRVKDGSITLHLNSTVQEFLKGKTIVQHPSNGRFEVKSDAVFILIGYRPDVTFLRSFGMTIDPETLAPAYKESTMETNVPNLFVAGGLVGGKFNNKVFIENGREHGKRIVDALRGRL